MTGDKLMVAKELDIDRRARLFVAVLGASDDWAVYSYPVEQIPPEHRDGSTKAQVWVALNGSMLDPKSAAFYFPVFNPKRYRP